MFDTGVFWCNYYVTFHKSTCKLHRQPSLSGVYGRYVCTKITKDRLRHKFNQLRNAAVGIMHEKVIHNLLMCVIIPIDLHAKQCTCNLCRRCDYLPVVDLIVGADSGIERVTYSSISHGHLEIFVTALRSLPSTTNVTVTCRCD